MAVVDVATNLPIKYELSRRPNMSAPTLAFIMRKTEAVRERPNAHHLITDLSSCLLYTILNWSYNAHIVV